MLIHPAREQAPGSVSFSMIEGFGPNNASINQLLMNVQNGRGVQAHGKNSQDCVAAFLVGAGYRAYFGMGGWSQKSPTLGDHWMQQFAFPLGEPLSDGVYTAADTTWRRSFKSGVKVVFELAGGKGTITGGPWTDSFGPDKPKPPHHHPSPPPRSLLPNSTAKCPAIHRGGLEHGDVGSVASATWCVKCISLELGGIIIFNSIALIHPARFRGDCCSACTARKDCAHWTWSKLNAPHECHLHDHSATPNVGTGRISGGVAAQ